MWGSEPHGSFFPVFFKTTPLNSLSVNVGKNWPFIAWGSIIGPLTLVASTQTTEL